MGFMLPLVSYMTGDDSTLDVAYPYARNLQQTATKKAITGSSWGLEAEMTLGLIGVLRDDPGHRQKATAMLDEALQISTDLGMRPLMERVLSKRDILKA